MTWRGAGHVLCVARVALAAAALLPAAPAMAQPADLVVVNAKVVTGDRRFSMAEAVAVREGRIARVGTSHEVRALVGPTTSVIDAAGRTLIPGLIDSHVHALMAAPAEAVTPFRNLTSIAEIQAWIRAEAIRTGGAGWIWSPRLFPTRIRERRFPTREELDAAAPDRPAAVDGAYALILNTAALKAAGITADTPDPPGGAIVKDADGTPSGLLRNVGGLLARFRPATAAAVPLDLLERVHRAYLRAGITSVIERGASVEGYRAYEALKQAGRLHVRATVTIQLPLQLQPSDAARHIRSLPLSPGAGDDRLKVGALKILADGGILAGTSFMREPYGLQARTLYGVDDPAYRGFLSMPAAAITAIVDAGHRAGWQMAAHVTGDAGVDTVLEAFETAQRQWPRADARHTLVHAYFPTVETARRAARLGVHIDTQPAWYYKDTDTLLGALGRPRLDRFIGLRTWLDAGARVAINTDHMFGLDADTALNPFNPFLTMYVAVTRRTEGGQVVGEKEAVTRQEALRMMTLDAAALSFDEATRGSIEVGKLGDLVLLSEDLLTCPEARIKDVQADLTIVGGRVVYERSAPR